MEETKKVGRPKKTTVETNNVEIEEKNNKENETVDYNKLISEMMKKISDLESQLENKKTENHYSQSNGLSKKIKVISLWNTKLNISTEPNGRGKVFCFDSYGDVKYIRFEDLQDVVSSYPRTTKKGAYYICDSEAVDALGLTDVYENLATKEEVDSLIELKDDVAFDVLSNMPKSRQKDIVNRIAKNLNDGASINFNVVRKIKENLGFDIEEIANNLKSNEDRQNIEE